MIEIVCSGSKDLASSFTLLSEPIRWKLARGRISSKLVLTLVFCGDWGRKSRVDQRDSENSGDSTSSPGEQQTFWSLLPFFSPAQDNNLAVSLNKKRNDSIAFFNRWFQHKSWIFIPVFTLHGTKNWLSALQSPNKTWFIPKTQHKSQRMKAALPCCCCCSTRKSLSLNVWTLSL